MLSESVTSGIMIPRSWILDLEILKHLDPILDSLGPRSLKQSIWGSGTPEMTIICRLSGPMSKAIYGQRAP